MITLLLSIIYLAFISLGLPDSLLESSWSVMRLEFNMPISSMGIITMIISIGTIISSLFSDKLTSRVKTPIIIFISVLLTALSIFGFSLSTKFWMICILAIPYGLGAGAIDSVLNNYVALHFSSRHMSWLHAFWGVGTIISPYIMSYALTSYYSWQLGYRIVACIQLVLTIVLALSIPLWKKVQYNENKEKEEITLQLTFKEKFNIKGIFYVMIGFFCYCAMEATAMYWSATYMVEAKKITIEIAAAMASLIYIGLTISRIISGIISPKLNDRLLIRYGIFIIIIGIVLLIVPTSTNVFLTYIGFVFIGFGCGPIYPSIIHSTPENFGKDKCGAVIGLQMASAYCGSTFIPPLFGLLSQYISIRVLPYYLFFFLIVLFIMIEKLNGEVKKKSLNK